MDSEPIRKASFLGFAILVGLAWTVTSSTVSWADGHGHRGHGHGQSNAGEFIWHILKAKDALGLSEDQDKRLRSLGTNFKESGPSTVLSQRSRGTGWVAARR
jgi:hypothetical protein